MTDAPGPDSRPSLLPVVLGFVFAGILLLALGFWAAQRQKNPPIQAPPALTLLSPTGDTAVTDTLTIHFETGAPLRLGPAGWATGRYHLHALLDSVELMPAASDIRQLPQGSYTWTITPVRPGSLQLIWALPSHTRLTENATQPFRLLPQ